MQKEMSAEMAKKKEKRRRQRNKFLHAPHQTTLLVRTTFHGQSQ